MTRIDIVILILVLAGLPLVYQTFWQQDEPAEYAEVFIDSKNQHQLSLKQDQYTEVQGVLGTSRLEIKQGRIRFVDSPCKGKVCIQQGWLASDGQLAACLPNKIAIQLAGQRNFYDSINF